MTPQTWTAPWIVTASLAQEGEVLGAPSAGAAEGSAAGGTTAAPGGGSVPGGAPAGGGGMGYIMPILMGVMLFMVFSTLMSGRKEKKKRAEMLSSIKKGDKVSTYGGIIGTIVELKDEEMVLKVHAGSNTRITFARSAIQSVLRSGRDAGERAGDGAADGVEDEGAAEPAELASR